MIINNCEQGSQEWFKAKAGVPSASNFDKIVDSKGNPSKQAKKYMYQLAGEKITGIREETYQNASMLRGVEMEAEARKAFEYVYGTKVDQVGMCLTDDKICGCSPDGMVGEKGLTEIKCPEIQTHVGYLLDNKLPTKYFQQVQGQLFVTGREWCVFMSYYPGIKPLLVNVERDEEFIKKLDKELKLFNEELEVIVAKIRG